MTRSSITFLLISLLGLVLFLTRIIPTAWVESLHAQGLFPLYRFLLSTPLSALPFSLTEVLIVLLAAGTVFAVARASLGPAPKETGGRRGAWKKLGLRGLLLVVLLLDLYLLGFGWLYQRAPLAERLGLPHGKSVADTFVEQAFRSATQARLSRVHLPETVEMADLSTRALIALRAVLPELQTRPLPACRLKGAWPKGLLLRFSVSGIFSPFTQEAHMDPAIHPLSLPFVAVHELAHLAGFGPEDEASFVAWLACTRSSDPWFRYSGHASAFTRFERQMPVKMLADLHKTAGTGVLMDRMKVAERAKKYVNPTLSRAAWRTYDKILRSQGIKAGVKSYDLMTTLVLAWKAKIRAEKPGD